MEVAGDGDEETEYESDPEEAKMSLKMRRREASDDEDGEEEDTKREAISSRPGIVVDSEGDSDGQGAAAEYDDEDEEEEEEYYDEQEEFEEEEKVVGEDEYEETASETVRKELIEGGDSRDVEERCDVDGDGDGDGEGEVKKENEPFAVPTSGAFYMHDDRFRDNNNAGGRHRRTFGGRKLWESKDDRKWGHDKFEEMNLEDRHNEEGRRSSRGPYRGRGKTRGADRGYARGGRMKGYGGNNNQGPPPKDVRGRGPRKYQPSMKNRSDTLSQHYKHLRKSVDKISHAGSGRISSTSASLNVEHEQVPAKKVASNLNSASPPFYPSGSSNKDIALTQKKEVQAGNHNRNIRPFVADHNFSVSHSNNMISGKNVIDSMGMDKLQNNDSVPPATVKPLNSVHMLPSAAPSVGATQMSQSRAQGRGGVPSGSAILQPQTNNQNHKVSPSLAQASQRLPVQSRGQSSQQALGQEIVQHSLGGSQTTSPPKGGFPLTTFEPGNFESPLESGTSKIAVAGKGKGSIQGTGRGALMYGGAQVMGSGGNVSTGLGDQNLPTFFPVMQFGGQHPGGGIPAVGMAFPGYVAQPNGLGNSEMTWLPVLSGALGASYCPPYLAVDGSYNPRPTGQTSALPAPSKDNNHSKSSNELKPQQRSDVVNDEFSQRQNKPRRYSEMNFSQ